MDEQDEPRLFIAIDLPAWVKDSLATAIDALCADLGGPYRWVAPRGVHLTLKFLGNVASDRVSGIVEAMARASGGSAPFSLGLNGTGTFPADRSPKVVWAGLDGGLDALVAIQRSIEAALEPLGFAPEQRVFSPHLTLARVRGRLSRADAERLAARLAEVRFEGAGAFAVDRVALIRSVLAPGGARYGTLAEAALGRPR